ncbi:MAG: thioesterase family protein [Gammaproteobacteria bacterium]|nr:thioesterase family protein [Pseudomonadales bacterium]MCP5345789.1 thioesterase family protein [Pseudomonadales bacterium]
MVDKDLPAILRQLRDDPGNRTEFTEAWTQGRSAFGGLSTAIAVSGLTKLLPEPQPVRSLMVSFIGPIPPGEVTVIPHVQRRGNNVTQLSAELLAEGELCLQVMAVFGRSRDTYSVQPQQSFSPEPRDSRRSFDRHRSGPPFLDYFEGAWTGGGIPFSGSRDNRLGIWARHRADMSEFPVEKIIALADIPPPVILSHYKEPKVPASSLTWSLEFVTEPELLKEDWFYLDYHIEHAAHGYTQQAGRLFTEQGTLCALSRQCMVYFDHRVYGDSSHANGR